MYNQVLARGAQPDELASYTNALATGQTLPQVQGEIRTTLATSDETTANIQAICSQLLGPDASGTEVADIQGQLAGGALQSLGDVQNAVADLAVTLVGYTPPPSGANFAGGPQAQAIDQTLFDLSADAYNLNGTGADGWSRVTNSQLQALKLNPSLFDDPNSGFHAALYTDSQGHYALAFKGTDSLKVLKDTDAPNARGELTDQYTEARDLGKAIRKSLGTANLATPNVVMTGHSLGGGLAAVAALAANTSAVTFNAAGVNNATINSIGSESVQAHAKMAASSRNYEIPGEMVDSIQQFYNLPLAMGHQIWLPDPAPSSHQFSPLDPDPYAHNLWQHQMEAIGQALQQSHPWTSQPSNPPAGSGTGGGGSTPGQSPGPAANSGQHTSNTPPPSSTPGVITGPMSQPSLGGITPISNPLWSPSPGPDPNPYSGLTLNPAGVSGQLFPSASGGVPQPISAPTISPPAIVTPQQPAPPQNLPNPLSPTSGPVGTGGWGT